MTEELESLRKQLLAANNQLREIDRMVHQSGAPNGPLLFRIKFLLGLLE